VESQPAIILGSNRPALDSLDILRESLLEGVQVWGHLDRTAQVTASSASFGVTLGKSMPQFVPGAPP
jgi:hypothetical protein